MAGGFFGGVLKGAESVQGMFLRQQEADARQKLADQGEWEFNQKKGLSDAMGGISAEQTQAEADQATAQQNTDDASRRANSVRDERQGRRRRQRA